MSIITGKSTNESLLGTLKDDVISGGGGNDTIRGAGGNDVLTGGAGNDLVFSDVFVFEGTRAANGFDTITDYQWWNTGTGKGDKLDLSNITAFTSKSDINDFVHFAFVGSNLVMYVDPDGTGSKYGFDAWAQFQNVEMGGNLRLKIGGYTFDVNIPANNHPPEIVGGASGDAYICIAENVSTVTTVTATDADVGDTLTYSISGGVDASLFTINSTTGALSFISAPNFEAPADSGGNNVYDVTVQVSDSHLATDSRDVHVTVNDVAEAPIITSGGGGASASVTAPENGTAVTTVVATDTDAGTTLTYSITGGADSSMFTINSSTGALSFLTAPNFEVFADSGANGVYDVTVQVSDGGLSDSQAIAVTVTNVNEPPIITSNGGDTTAAVSVAENTTAVTAVTATDVDAGATQTYSIVAGGDAAFFTINSSTGVLSFSTAPDFETPLDSGGNNVYDVTVQVSDGTLSDTQAIAVTVTDALPSAVGDIVIYGFNATTSITIPRWALLFNDVNTDSPSDPWYNVINNSWAIATVTPVTGTATLSSGNVSYGGLAAGGAGLFTYALTGTAAATVLTGRSATDTSLTGTSGDDILIGGKSGGPVTPYTMSGGSGKDVLVGNTGDDSLTGGEGGDVYFGGVGLDTLTLTETTAVTDYIRLDTVTAAGDRDTITGFTVGAGGTRDVILLSESLTTQVGAGVTTATITQGATLDLSAATADMYILRVDNTEADVDLGSSTSGSQLFDGINSADGSVAVTVAANELGYILAYDNGNAYLYYFHNNGNTGLTTSEVDLIGVINGVAVDSLSVLNFLTI